MKNFLAILFLVSALNAAAAPTIKERPRLLNQPLMKYPEQAKAEGHQGTVELLLSITAEGSIKKAEVFKSTQSPLLDAAAIEYASQWQFSPAIDSDGKPVAVAVKAPIKYIKDSLEELPTKTCKDFNVDVQWFKSTYPSLAIAEMNIYNMSLGILAAGSGSISKIIETNKKFGKSFEKTITYCSNNPDGIYWKNITSEMNSWF